MAISGFSFTSRSQFHLRNNPLFFCVRKAWPKTVAAIEAFEVEEHFPKYETSHNSVDERAREPLTDYDDSRNSVNESVVSGVREWKKLNSKELGITTSKINKPTKKVLNILRQKGFDVYLVGGCVRDLILNRTPKDFDIITSAELREVRKAFSWCEIVGKRFPICHVHMDNTIVEVSSFSTSRNRAGDDSNHLSELPTGFDETDYARWRNCLHRDFTINGFMFDPYASVVYDYLGGIADLKKTKIRTVIPAGISFQEDAARILRAIRIAARLEFRISRETAHFIKQYSGSVQRLDKARLLMEVNYMLAYGSAEASLRKLWKFGLLEILLPMQAAYFAHSGFRRQDKRTNMLLALFSNMDKLLAPDKPCHAMLWVAILAFHKTLYNRPQDPLVVAATSLAVYNGGDITEAIKIAKRITIPHDNSFQELLEPQNKDSEELKNEVMDLASSIRQTVGDLTDGQLISLAMSRYPKAPFSDLVLIPLGLDLRVRRIFEFVRVGHGLGFKQGSKINYESLAMGSLEEVRHVFARIIFDTMYPLKLTKKE